MGLEEGTSTDGLGEPTEVSAGSGTVVDHQEGKGIFPLDVAAVFSLDLRMRMEFLLSFLVTSCLLEKMGRGGRRGTGTDFFFLQLADLLILRALPSRSRARPVRSRALVFLMRKDSLLPKTVLSR